MASLAVQQTTFADANFLAIPLMTETSSGNAPAASDLDRWQDRHGFSGEIPLLADPGWATLETYVGAGPNSFAVLVDAQMRIVVNTAGSISDDAIVELLAQ